MDGAALAIGGFAMGFAGSLHCSCVCGGIASSLLLAARSDDPAPASQARALAAIQAGRALTYALGGALVASVGSSFAGLLYLAGWQPVVRVAAAFVIVAVGLSIAGILPRSGLSTFVRAVNERLRRTLPRRVAGSVPLLSGMAWGLAPCGMVYNALMMAMVTGSAVNGALFMSGFALATVPAVSLAAFGSAHVVRGSRTASRKRLKTTLGASLAVFGLVSAAIPAHSLTSLCLPG
jgi:uncharacterized protein